MDNTCQNSDLNEDIRPPRTHDSKSEAMGQLPDESQQLLLGAGQPQLPEPEHRLTAATRERHSIASVGGEDVSRFNKAQTKTLSSLPT